MNYNFEFNSPVIGRIQPFEYSYVATNEYAFTYDRDIFSDLRKFNAPIFVGKRERGIFYYKCRELLLSKRDRDITLREDQAWFSKPINLEISNTKVSLELLDKQITQNRYISLEQRALNTNVFMNNPLLKSDNKTHVFTEGVSINSRDNNTNCYEYNMLHEKDNNIDIIREFLLKERIGILNVYNVNAINKKDAPKKITITKIQQAKRGTLLLDTFDELFLNDFPIILNIYKTPELKKKAKDTILSTQITVKDLYPQEHLRIAQNRFLEGPINNLYVNEIKSLYEPLGTLYVYKDFMLTGDINHLQTFSIKWGQGEINHLCTFDIKILRQRETDKIFLNKEIYAIGTDNHLYVYNILSSKIDDKKYYTNCYAQITVRKNTNRYTNINKMKVSFKDIHDTHIFKEMLGQKQNKIAYLDYRVYSSIKDSKKGIKNKDLFGFHSEKESLILRRIYSIFKDIKYVNKFKNKALAKDVKDTYTSQSKSLEKDIKKSVLNNVDALMQEVQIKTFKQNILYYLHREIAEISLMYEEKFLSKENKGVFWKSFSDSFSKRTKILQMNNNENIIINARDKVGFSILDNIYELSLRDNGINVDNTQKWLSAFKKDTAKDKHWFAYKGKFNTAITYADINLADKYLPLGIESHDNTIGFILAGKNTFVDNNSQTISTNSMNSFSAETKIFLEKDKEKANSLGNIFIITEQKKAFIDYYHGIMMTNNAKKTMLNFSELTFDKILKNTKYYAGNTLVTINKNAFIQSDISILKISKYVGTERNNVTFTMGAKSTSIENGNIDITIIKKGFMEYTEVYVHKDGIETTLNNSEFYVNIFKNGFTQKEEWINRKIYIGNASNTQIDVDKIYEAFIANDEVFVDKAVETEVFTNSVLPASKRKEINVDTGDYIFITKQQYETNKYVSELKQMQKTIKDMERPVVKTYNWAYVYQYEDPIDPNYEYYGLDELLLPEKDFDYSTFEDIIFDKEKMRPRKPIKILDDNTFIAKYPIKHPTPDYEETGIIYIDVPADLMYDIFMKFYQIWYANIFKFGNMSMVDSLKLMLDYIYSYIILSYSGTEYLEPALRVFRQIRWFGETSVMHNAQYKITCEYEDLKSNLQSGECQIENELCNFYVNKTLKVLATTSTVTGNEAYIKLYAYNREDSKVSFSVSFSGGNVEVYINDDYVDTIYSNCSYISYELPATNTENTIVLKRQVSNNVGFCYVGNIVIEKGKYKNLSIEYDPELKSGNMPLNDVVNKMVILANMYDNQAEVFDQFRKGNLAVSELYKKLESYWEMHHANKEKGKRLTIKET